MSCGGCRCGLDLMLLWLWHRPAAISPIRSLAWEPPYAVGVALKSKKQKLTKIRKKVAPSARKGSPFSSPPSSGFLCDIKSSACVVLRGGRLPRAAEAVTVTSNLPLAAEPWAHARLKGRPGGDGRDHRAPWLSSAQPRHHLGPEGDSLPVSQVRQRKAGVVSRPVAGDGTCSSWHWLPPGQGQGACWHSSEQRWPQGPRTDICLTSDRKRQGVLFPEAPHHTSSR